MSDEVTKMRRIRAEVQLISRLARAGIERADYACPLCGAGQVAVRVLERDAIGRVLFSAGRCSTPDCLAWSR